MEIKFIIDQKKKRLETWFRGKRIHMIVDKSHLDEIKKVSGMAHLEDFEAYSKYLKTQGFWDVDLLNKIIEIVYEN